MKTTQTAKIISLSITIMLFANLDLFSQEENKKLKSIIGAGLSSILPNHQCYGDDNFGVDVFFRHNFKKKVPTSYYCINANFINYKNDSITKNDYSVTLGKYYISEPLAYTNPMFSISFCLGVNFGVLYKNDLYYGCLSIDNGFVWKIYKNLNFEIMIKTKFNPSDKTHTDGVFGLSFSF